MNKIKATCSKYNSPLTDSDSDSDSSVSDNDHISNNSSDESTNKLLIPANKTKKSHKQTHTYTNIMPVPTSRVTKQIQSMKAPLYYLLKTENGHEDHIRRYNLHELKTVRNIFRSVHNLKHTRRINNNYKIPESAITAFKTCEHQINALYAAHKKKEIQNAILTIMRIDNFKSMKDILTANDELYRMNRRISKKKLTNNGKKN